VSVQPAQGELPGMPEPLYAASPSKLLTFLDCPRRYRLQYLDRPSLQRRTQRAHTSLGTAVHNALRDWWDLSERTPGAGGGLLDRTWVDVGFRDAGQSREWRERMRGAVMAYLGSVDPATQPVGIERTVSFVSGDLRMTGRVDRIDERAGELVVVDYKTSRVAPTDDDARTSLPLALYAAAVWKMFRRRTLRVELHHVPSGTVAAHEHTPESLARKVEQARSIARDARRADLDFGEKGEASELFPARPGPLCGWCDLRAHCPEGKAVGPEKSGWAALEEPVGTLAGGRGGDADRAGRADSGPVHSGAVD
jgi:RecB family exonuclease